MVALAGPAVHRPRRVRLDGARDDASSSRSRSSAPSPSCPAVLALLGDRVDKRPPARSSAAAAPRAGRGVVGRARPRRHAPPGRRARRRRLRARRARRPGDRHAARRDRAPAALPDEHADRASPSAQIERAFPGAPNDAELVVTGRRPARRAAQRRLRGARRAGDARSPAAAGRSTSARRRDGRTAVVTVPMPDRGDDAAEATVARRCAPTSPPPPSGSARRDALVTGDAAGSARLHEPAARPRRRSSSRFVLVLALRAAARGVPLARRWPRAWWR